MRRSVKQHKAISPGTGRRCGTGTGWGHGSHSCPAPKLGILAVGFCRLSSYNSLQILRGAPASPPENFTGYLVNMQDLKGSELNAQRTVHPSDTRPQTRAPVSGRSDHPRPHTGRRLRNPLLRRHWRKNGIEQGPRGSQGAYRHGPFRRGSQGQPHPRLHVRGHPPGHGERRENPLGEHVVRSARFSVAPRRLSQALRSFGRRNCHRPGSVRRGDTEHRTAGGRRGDRYPHQPHQPPRQPLHLQLGQGRRGRDRCQHPGNEHGHRPRRFGQRRFRPGEGGSGRPRSGPCRQQGRYPLRKRNRRGDGGHAARRFLRRRDGVELSGIGPGGWT